MSGKKEFRYDSVQDLESIITYLEALVQGLRQGQLDFIYKDQEMSLRPQGFLEFFVEAATKGEETILNGTVFALATAQQKDSTVIKHLMEVSPHSV